MSYIIYNDRLSLNKNSVSDIYVDYTSVYNYQKDIIYTTIGFISNFLNVEKVALNPESSGVELNL